MDLSDYAMFPGGDNLLDNYRGITPGLDELEKFNQSMEKIREELNEKSGFKGNIINYEEEIRDR